MKLVSIEPMSAEWHRWRASGIGGSDAGVIAADAGLVKPAKWMKSIESLWKVKTGREGDFGGNWATRKGQQVEPIARSDFETATGILLSPLYGEMDGNPVVRSSFDGINYQRDVIGECKLASSYVRDLVLDNQIPEYYKPQLAHQAMTAWGMPESWSSDKSIAFIVHDADAKKTLWVMIKALELRTLAEKLYENEVKFWEKVTQDTEPCGEDWKLAASQYLIVSAQIEALKKEEEVARARLIELLGDAEKISAAGVSVARQTRQGSIDYSKIVTEHCALSTPEIEAYRKKSSVSTVVRVL